MVLSHRKNKVNEKNNKKSQNQQSKTKMFSGEETHKIGLHMLCWLDLYKSIRFITAFNKSHQIGKVYAANRWTDKADQHVSGV